MNTVSSTNRFERRRERTRSELLTAATRVMGDKGLHDTKIADIAAAADVGVGTFYLHFETKEALFDAVVADAVVGLKAAVEDARAAETDPVARLRAANAAFCRFVQENGQVFRIVFGHAASYNDVIHAAQAEFAADIAANVREGIASGAFAPIDPDLAAQAIVGMTTQLLTWWSAQESLPMAVLQETMTTLALNGLTPAPAPKKKGARHG
jgi:AcrR family transcriptional regulator